MGTSEPQAAARGNQAMKFAAGAIVLAAITILLMPTPEGMLPEGKRLIAVTILMAGLWVTQAIPLAATSLLPLVLFPVLGIQTAKEVSSSYINDNVFLYLGGFIIALGIERWHLHRRIALNVVRVVGVSPKRLVLGFLLATAGLSMWISNTATTMLMLPIALALLKTLDDEQSRNAAATGADARPDLLSKRLAVPLLLAIAYAASIGGLTTIIGTPTNNQAVGNYRKLFVAPVTADMKRDSGDAATVGQRYGEEGAVAENARRSQLDISVAQWMLACVPIGAIYLFVTWFVLTFRLPGSTSHDVTMKAELAKRLRGLGKATFAERMMLAVFVSTAVLWVFRQPLVIGTTTILPGWSGLVAGWFRFLGVNAEGENFAVTAASFINDSTVSMFVAVLLFCLPSGTRDCEGRSVPLMDWKTASGLPWDIMLLFGGGFALAGAFGSTQLSQWLGDVLQGPLQGKPIWLVIAIVCLLMTFLTEFTSNVATINILMPTLCAICVALKIDPRMLVVPATLATSCAFMLPIATPPHAIVFGSGRIKVADMVAYGILLNLMGVPILTAGTYLFIKPLMGIP